MTIFPQGSIYSPALCLNLVWRASHCCGWTFLFCFMYMSVFLNVCGCTRSPEEGIGFPPSTHGTGVKNGCELLCGCWELTLGPLEGKPVLLTTEPAPVWRNLHRLSLPQSIILVHSISDIMLRRSSEAEGSNHFGLVGNAIVYQRRGNTSNQNSRAFYPSKTSRSQARRACR